MKLDLPRLDAASLEALGGTLVKAFTAREYRAAVVAGAALVLGLGVWYVAFVQPASARLAALTARHERAQRQLASLGTPATAAEVKRQVAGLEARVREALERMAQDVQLVQVLKQLSTHAARYQVVVDRIDVKPVEVAVGGPAAAGARDATRAKSDPEKKRKPPLDIRTQRLELALTCSYEAAARFLDELRTLPAFMVVDKLEIEREPTGFPDLKVVLILKFHSIKQSPEELLKA